MSPQTQLAPTAGRLTLADLTRLRSTYGGELERDQLGGVRLVGAVFAGQSVDLGPVAA